MFYRDHGPPHFHAIYGDYAVTISIREESVTGKFPKRALKLVLEWCELHKEELLGEPGVGSTKKDTKTNSAPGVSLWSESSLQNTLETKSFGYDLAME